MVLINNKVGAERVDKVFGFLSNLLVMSVIILCFGLVQVAAFLVGAL
tara:strand:+ start:348 stop:488 length:141 start_codon:yes stop_codon:yes gene_type:complete